jgi:hypothetical protein
MAIVLLLILDIASIAADPAHVTKAWRPPQINLMQSCAVQQGR